MRIFTKCQPRRIVQISGNLTGKFIKKKPTARKHFRLRAYFFSAVRNSMCKCRCGWEKSVGKIRHFYLEDAAERKTSVAYLTSCERCRHSKNKNASLTRSCKEDGGEKADGRSASVTKCDYIINENSVLPRRRTNFAKCDAREKRDATKFRRAWSWFRNLWLAI